MSRPGQIRFYRPIKFNKGKAMLRFEFHNPEGLPLKCRITAAPALENMVGRNAQKGESKYDFDEAILIDLTGKECFKLGALFDLFLSGRFPQFVQSCDSYKKNDSGFERHIIHDSSLAAGGGGSKLIKRIEVDVKDNFKMFFRLKVQDGSPQGKGRELKRINLILDYWEIKELAETLPVIGLTLNGLHQINAIAKFDTSGGNITEPFSQKNDNSKLAGDIDDIPTDIPMNMLVDKAA